MAYKIGLYPERWESIESLSLEDKGKILDNIFSYSVKGEIEHKGYIEIIFNFMKNRIDADKESYENKCHKNQEIGKLGGRPKKTYKNRSVISETQTVISKPNSNSNSNYNILSKDNKKEEINDFQDFKERWNGVKQFGAANKGLPKIIKDTPNLIALYKKKREIYTFDEIIKSVQNYCNYMITIPKEQSFHTHRFSMIEFLEQKNGLEKYINFSS